MRQKKGVLSLILGCLILFSSVFGLYSGIRVLHNNTFLGIGLLLASFVAALAGLQHFVKRTQRLDNLILFTGVLVAGLGILVITFGVALHFY